MKSQHFKSQPRSKSTDNKVFEKDTESKEEQFANKINFLIPKFFFGKKTDETKISDHILQEINNVYSSNNHEDLDVSLFEPITSRIFELPKYFNQWVFAKVDKDKRGKISKEDLIKVWKSEYAHITPQVRCFNIIKKPTYNYLSAEDLKIVLNVIMEVHPGLDFLKATPEFQDKYSDTVIQRIFYSVDKNDDGKISRREFTQSNLFNALKHVDEEQDINKVHSLIYYNPNLLLKVRAYFSYEHFYVLYCQFWELDLDHDFLITKEEFSRYSDNGLSKKAVDRIFDQVPRKFKSRTRGKMSYEDFIWFILSEEDKTTYRGLEYWFKVMDLDENNIIAGYEMEFFYEEQKQRQIRERQEPVDFEDIFCEMVDIFHPDQDTIFRIEHFKQYPQLARKFFNSMLNLRKFNVDEQRDPLSIRTELNENPDFTDWDRFAEREYIKFVEQEELAANLDHSKSGKN